MTRSSRLRFGLLALGLAGGASLLVAATTLLPQTPVETIDTSRLQQSFAEEFNGNRLDSKRWDQGTPTNLVTERTLSGNAERQVYFSPDWLGLDIQPVTIADGAMRITARPMTAPERAVIAANVAALPPGQKSPALAQLAYVSGRITTLSKFSQRYGYFEMRARFSAGQGLWPALWLLPADQGWPPEIDIMEALGHDPNTIISTIHSAAIPKQDVVVKLTSSSADYHRYGVLWGPETIEYYVDGAKTASLKTPPDAHKPMYVIANLAVGGNWPGYPDATTRFPATMDVDYVRAWKWRDPGGKR